MRFIKEIASIALVTIKLTSFDVVSSTKTISIITVVYNNVDLIEQTIQSVINQPAEEIQYVIIDGGSTDGTVEKIREYEEQIDYWISEPDKGIYDAMNKGIEVAAGEGLLFLNSGDYFVGEVLVPSLPIPCFLPVKYENFFGKEVFSRVNSHKTGLPQCHQGIVFENRGLKYDLRYSIASDYDYFLRHGYDNSLPVANVDGYVYYDNAGLSASRFVGRDQEIQSIIKSHFGLFWSGLFAIKAAIKKGIKTLRNAF